MKALQNAIRGPAAVAAADTHPSVAERDTAPQKPLPVPPAAAAPPAAPHVARRVEDASGDMEVAPAATPEEEQDEGFTTWRKLAEVLRNERERGAQPAALGFE